MKKTFKKSRNKMITGVCGGIAEYFDIDPTIVRLITVVVAVGYLFVPIFLTYVVAAVLLPSAED